MLEQSVVGLKLVMKFGGASMENARNIRHIAKLIEKYKLQGNSITIVISALKGITNKLMEISEETKKNGNEDYIDEFTKQMGQMHTVIARQVLKNKDARTEVEQKIKEAVDDLERVSRGIIYLNELSPKTRDCFLSFGERLSTPIVYGALKDLGLKAEYFDGRDIEIITDSNFGEAIPLMDTTEYNVRQKIEPLLEENTIPVITGYMATDQNGEITTLGRGGSDYTATLLGAALRADEVWLWKDVDGFMTCDPKIVPSARMIPKLSFEEAVELAALGATVIHPRALEPAVEENIPVRIRNAFNTENTGTLVSQNKETNSENAVKAITLVDNVALINVNGSGMIGIPGIAAKLFTVLGENNINVLAISQSVSEANISFIINRNMLARAISKLGIAFSGRGIIRQVTPEDDVCVVAVIGEGMRGTLGVASRLFTTVARAGVNIRMIAQGSSELNISFVVKEKDGEAAVRAIHKEFKLDKA